MNILYFRHDNMTALVPVIWHYVTGTFSFLCLLCGLLLNGLVMFVFIRNSNLRRPINFFVINLAITDLGLLLTNNTLHIIASFNKHWPFGQTGCSFYALSGGICGLTSIATMVFISLTRLKAVVNPFSSLKLTSHFTLKCIACSWIYGSIWIILPLFGWNRFIFEGFGTTCTFDYISKSTSDRLYIFILVIGGFLIPLLIILISYTIILIKLSERGRHIMCSNADDQLPSRKASVHYYHSGITLDDERSRSETTFIESNEDNQITRNVRRTEARAARTALLVITIFCVAWGPYALMVVLSQIGMDHFVNPYTTAILGSLTKTAACINPLIYALSSSIFHQQICSYINFLYTCRNRSHRLSSCNYDFNRKRLTFKINRIPTSSDLSHQR